MAIRTSAGERTEYTLDKLPRKMMNNRVLVKVDNNLDDGCVIPNTDLVLAGGEWNEASRMIRHGEVVMIPDKLTYRSKDVDSEGLMEWETDLDVQVGDNVYFGLMASANVEALYVKDELYYVIPYSRFILRMRDGVITPLNGYCLLKEVLKDKMVGDLILVLEKEVDRKMGVVTHVGKKNRKYYGTETVDADVEVGDTVLFSKSFYGYLEDDLFATLPKGTGYCQLSWVEAKM